MIVIFFRVIPGRICCCYYLGPEVKKPLRHWQDHLFFEKGAPFRHMFGEVRGICVQVENTQTFPKQCRRCVSERDMTFRRYSDSDNCYMATLLVAALKKASKLAEICGLKNVTFLSNIKLCLTEFSLLMSKRKKFPVPSRGNWSQEFRGTFVQRK